MINQNVKKMTRKDVKIKYVILCVIKKWHNFNHLRMLLNKLKVLRGSVLANKQNVITAQNYKKNQLSSRSMTMFG